MNLEIIDQLKTHLSANGLPYPIPIHPNLVHLTIALFILGITFDFIGALFSVQKPIFKFLAVPTNRSSFFEAGWYNIVGSALVTLFTVAAGFYEMMLAEPPTGVKSAWGLDATATMLWHGMGGVFLGGLIVGMAIWRGLQRYLWDLDDNQQVQWSYLFSGLFIILIMFIHGTLGAHLAAEFGIHNTADMLLRLGQDPNLLLR
ncbi:DUF2231 domain-containing protein [Nostoc sp. FACHB-110]|uniref:DUF2231 domain-containing protein n=1 Tax=Nostoc sp. FACHB-110 TaxID=2692834 RepID=UPI0016856A11|nr:DUF2231 domain-containing protein [Nostoc sp. FACHB-110]MBD2437803.1 DUF2231 domain-containing protein [Nostoc sp. FACHB-110]